MSKKNDHWAPPWEPRPEKRANATERVVDLQGAVPSKYDKGSKNSKSTPIDIPTKK